jgi:hypothetical protein
MPARFASAATNIAPRPYFVRTSSALTLRPVAIASMNNSAIASSSRRITALPSSVRGSGRLSGESVFVMSITVWSAQNE